MARFSSDGRLIAHDPGPVLTQEPSLYTVVMAAGNYWIRIRNDEGGTSWVPFWGPTDGASTTWAMLSSIAKLGPARLIGDVLADGDLGDLYRSIIERPLNA